ncbi:TetR/AcrR family transcriptional regulator [Streptomyces sp. LX-29]|uniref:TetR/AcrR family transcriptional regulator n=1 Tax=Streptomyces sp. LX-29 TaxID=2900152 RepID=UPI00240D14E8|nr:TetR/AcrR family transcriptional regulator [Streptomyces sp. LX-29]WFB08328.1 TetR/AcrR family transcriptional regulator [Streptomyces sp. LX-29]
MATGRRVSRPRISVWLAERPASRRKPHQAPAPERGAVRAPDQGPGREAAQGATDQGVTDGTGQGGAEQMGTEQAAGLDLDRIVGATVRLLDAEGLAKFSMRRLAAELGVTAMSVYWYVDTKDDLLELALDAVNGEMALPDPTDESADWRDQLRQLAVEYRRLLLAHPWVSQLTGQFINVGPHWLAFSNATLRVMGRSGLPMEGRTGAIAAVFQFVYGFATNEGLFDARCKEAGMEMDDYFKHIMTTIRARPEFAEPLAEPARVMEARGGSTLQEMRERDFAFALDTVIAGIEAMRDRGGR